jgi:ABC-type bacteriocin/lantibiotic exporter with double-glycine peptidase domain
MPKVRVEQSPSEIDKVGGFVGEGLSQPVVNLGMLLAIIGYMLVVEPLVAAFSILFLLPQAIIVPAIQVRLNRLIEKRLGLLRDLSDTIVDTRESGQDIEDIEESGLQSKLGRIYANRITFLVLKFAVKGIVNILNALAPLTVLLVGGYLAMQGKTTLGVVVAFMSGFERLSDPMRELLAYYRVAAQANVQHRMIARWI